MKEDTVSSMIYHKNDQPGAQEYSYYQKDVFTENIVLAVVNTEDHPVVLGVTEIDNVSDECTGGLMFQIRFCPPLAELIGSTSGEENRNKNKVFDDWSLHGGPD